MKRTTYGMGAVVLGLAILVLYASPANAAQRPGYETYVVRSGDTLSKISGRIFGDAQRWREILKENPQVTNANRIFPGDILLLPVVETAAPAGGTGESLAARAGAGTDSTVVAGAVARTDDSSDQGAVSEVAAGADGVDGAAEPAGEPGAGMVADAAATAQELPAEMVRTPAVINPAVYRNAGYITDKLPTIAIVASQDDRLLLGTNDAAIVGASIIPGTRFTVVRADRRIFHPVTGAYLGWLIRILGSAEVTCRDERTSTVALRAMNAPAGIGDYLLPIDPNDVLEKNVLAERVPPGCVPAGPRDGVIVAFNEDRQQIGEYELAYIDRGTQTGVAPGQRFTIYREIAPEGRVAVGELQVLRAGAHTSTALITTSFQEIQVGLLLRAR